MTAEPTQAEIEAAASKLWTPRSWSEAKAEAKEALTAVLPLIEAPLRAALAEERDSRLRQERSAGALERLVDQARDERDAARADIERLRPLLAEAEQLLRDRLRLDAAFPKAAADGAR